LARPGTGFAQTGRFEFEVDPARAEDFSRLLQCVASNPDEPIGIVHLWSLDAEGKGSLTGFQEAHELGCGAATCLLQSIANSGWRTTPRLWMVTRNAQAVGEEHGATSVAQAPLWGLGRVLAYEHPEMRSILVDLDSRDISDSAQILHDELTMGNADDEVAWRETGRYVPRMIHADVSAELPAAFGPDATYLVTGGFGGIGLRLAEWLVSKGVRSLALAGRHAPAAEAERLSAMRRAGARIAVVGVDVAERDQVEGMLRKLESSGPPLKGIFHCAGVLDDGALLEMNAARFRTVARPKIDGAWNLHTLTQHLELDHFVLFSSTASLIGSPGQSNYAAANAFLDALAHRRKEAGQPGLSINWGAWSEVGMAAAESKRGDKMALRGMQSMSPEEAFDALALLLQSREAQQAVARFDVTQWIRHYPQRFRGAMLRGLLQEGQVREAAPPASSRNIRAELSAAHSARERRQLLGSFVRDEVGQVTGLGGDRIDPEVDFLALGIDSLMAIELRNRIMTRLEVSPPLQRFLKDANVARLRDDLLDRLALAGVAMGSSTTAIAHEDLEHISI
jgi:NAD(P)-dependent dehydrogenase (short-subunit alcohol dehydrogenase family)